MIPCDRCEEDCPDGAGFWVEPEESDYWAMATLCESCFIDVVEDGMR